MIRRFRHKGLERWFRQGDLRRINAKFGPHLQRMLDMIDQATAVEQLDIPGMNLHSLKGERKGMSAMIVYGNWRLTFRFDGEDAMDLNLEDYH